MPTWGWIIIAVAIVAVVALAVWAAMRARRTREPRSTFGIVLVWFALALTVMLLASAFAVDVGGWYKRSQELQIVLGPGRSHFRLVLPGKL